MSPTTAPTGTTDGLLTHGVVSRLRREAIGHITGRAAFERHIGRASNKPLPQVEVDPHVLLALIEAAFPSADARP